MQYLERLDSVLFLEIIKNFDKCIITEKFDGCNIILKKYNDKIFFSRERKSKTKNILTKDDFDKDNPYHIPFISAWDFLNSIRQQIPEGIYEIEILFGKTPNVLTYGFKTSKIVILHEIKDNRYSFDLNKFKKLTNIFVKNYFVNPITNKHQTVIWTLETNKILEKPINYELLEPSIQKLKNLSEQINEIFNIENKFIETAKLNTKPFFAKNVKNWKSLLKHEREYLKKETEKYKKMICKIILDHYLNEKNYGRFEGIVIYYPKTCSFYKIINPYFKFMHEKFAKLNRKYPFTKADEILNKKRNMQIYKNIVSKAWNKFVEKSILENVYDIPQKHYVFNLFMWKKFFEKTVDNDFGFSYYILQMKRP